MKWKVGGFDAIMTDPGTVCQLLKRSLRDKERKSSGERWNEWLSEWMREEKRDVTECVEGMGGTKLHNIKHPFPHCLFQSVISVINRKVCTKYLSKKK